MEPNILQNNQIITLKLTGFIEINQQAYAVKQEHAVYRKAWINTNEKAGEILAYNQKFDRYYVLEPITTVSEKNYFELMPYKMC